MQSVKELIEGVGVQEYEAAFQEPEAPRLPVPLGSKDPSTIGYPPLLPVEVALAESPIAEICGQYGITRQQFMQIFRNPAFQRAYEETKKSLLVEGMSFRIKARLQSIILLQKSWQLIHKEHTPANVAADLIKATWRVAGFEPKADDRAPVVPIQINVNL